MESCSGKVVEETSLVVVERCNSKVLILLSSVEVVEEICSSRVVEVIS